MSQKSGNVNPVANNWVQVTLGCAFLFFLSQQPGAPDPARWAIATL